MNYSMIQIERFAAEVGASLYRYSDNILSYILPDGKTLISFRETTRGQFTKI